MGMQVVAFEQAVDVREQEAYGSDPSFLDHIRRTASRALADLITRDAALYKRIDPPEKDRDNPFAPVRHQWSIGIERDMSEIEAREAQMDEARRAGLREAATHLRECAAKYEAVDGHCKWVLMNSLREAASDLDKKASASVVAKERGHE